MGKVGRVIAGILLAVTVPATVVGTVYTVQNFDQVKSWIKGESPSADEKPVGDTEKDEKIKELEAKIQEHLLQIENLQTTISELQQGHEDAILDYQGQIAILQGQISSLETQIEELEEALASQEQKVEITDWTFVGNSLGAYKGSADVIDNIPTSYSVVESVSTPQTLSSEEEFYSFIEGKMSDEGVLYGNPVRVTFTLLDLTKNYANYAEFIADFEVLAGTYNVSDLYTCTIEESNNTYYEGNDIQVNTVGLSTFANTTATTIILPKKFTNLGTIGLSDNVLNFVINSDSPNLEIASRGPYCRFFVPAEFYDSYVSRFEADAPLFIIEADVEPELTYSSFSDFTSSPVEASPQYSHLLAIESYKGTETNVVVPGKSDEKYIYEIRSFETSTAVESIVLPKQIDTIKFDAFKNLTSLTSLTIYCQKVIYAEKGVSIVEPELPSACNIYVPSILVGYYKEAWPTLANRIFAIE